MSQLIELASPPYIPAFGVIVTRAASAASRMIDAMPGPSPAGEELLSAYLGYVRDHLEDYALQEAAGAILRERVTAALAGGRPVPASWLGQLEGLADADDPRETILHALALQARCDHASSTAAAGTIHSGLGDLRAAFSRWQRHPESPDCTSYFVASALSIADAAAHLGDPAAEEAARQLARAAVQQAETRPRRSLWIRYHSSSPSWQQG